MRHTNGTESVRLVCACAADRGVANAIAAAILEVGGFEGVAGGLGRASASPTTLVCLARRMQGEGSQALSCPVFEGWLATAPFT